MTLRTATFAAWSLATVAVLATAGGLFFALQDGRVESDLQGLSPVDVVLALATPLGALLASRRRSNPIGWLLCALGVDSGLTVFCLEYGAYGLEQSSLTAARPVYWVGTWVGPWGFAIGVFLLLLFPTGKALSRRWLAVGWAATGFVAVFTAATALLPWPGQFEGGPRNQFAVRGWESALESSQRWSLFGLAMALAAAALSVGIRFGRARGEVRQQLKWFAYASALAALVTLVMPFSRTLWLVLSPLAYGAIPAAIAVAILRYRLYAIDHIINRTLVYGSLTAVLAGAYLLLVVLLQLLLGSFTTDSDLAVAASTLAIAALFGPARRSIQRLIDRSFYRARYDAIRTIERFTSQMLGATETGTLGRELVEVVDDTLQPTRLSLWLRVGTPG